MKFSFDMKSKSRTKIIETRVRNKVKEAVRVVAQDVARTSSGATPHYQGDLAGSYSIAYQFSGDMLTATVEYAVFNGGFNYAIAMHEWTYKLGEGSKAKGGGTGMSGKTYAVGNKFLTRVLEGEAQAYTDYINEQIRKALGG